jgi:hypothetical protein
VAPSDTTWPISMSSNEAGMGWRLSCERGSST